MGISEQYMTPHARFPVASPVVAAELLSFRLKGGKSRSSSSGGTSSGKQRATGGVRSGKYGLLLQRDEWHLNAVRSLAPPSTPARLSVL